MKLLKLQVVLQHVIGQQMSCLQLQPPPPAPTVKLVRDDGLVTIYQRPVRVSELLARFPKHLVCRSDALYIGQKIPSLSAQELLQPGTCYFLLPYHCFQSALSFVSLASFLQGSKAQSSTSLIFQGVQPLDIQKAPSGALRIRVSGDFVSRLMEQGKIKATGTDEYDDRSGTAGAGQMMILGRSRVCSTPQLQRDYSMLVGSRLRCWEPKLETISEADYKVVKKRSSASQRRKISSNFGMKKSQRKKLQQQEQLSNCASAPQMNQSTVNIKSSRKTN